MKFQMEGLTVFFPYEYIYPEQARLGCSVQDISDLCSRLLYVISLSILHVTVTHSVVAQFQYMLELKHALDAKGHCLLEVCTLRCRDSGRAVKHPARKAICCASKLCCHSQIKS